MNNLSTKLIKLDFETILKNYKKPEFWQKEWLIFKHNDLEIVWYIKYIDTRSNRIMSSVNIKKAFNYYCKKDKKNIQIDSLYDWWAKDLDSIPINHSDYNQVIFERNLLHTCLELLNYIEAQIIFKTREYQKAQEMERVEERKLRDIAKEFLDEEGVKNAEIRDAYISDYVSRHSKSDLTSNVLKNREYKVIPYEYLLLISYFNADKVFDDYKKKIGRRSENVLKKIWLEGKKLNSKKWVDEMKSYLKSVSEE